MSVSFDFQGHLAKGCARLGLTLDPGANSRLELYFEELRRWSGKVNLIARDTGDQEILDKHFLDSLAVLPLLTGESVHLLDVGSGAGFPGLVCKAARPDLIVTLVEPRLKRVSFLRHVARTLGINEGLSVLAGRVEDVQPLTTQPFTHITCRAVTDLAAFFRLIEHLWLPGTRIIAMKGPKWSEELAACPLELRGMLEKRVEYQLPFSGVGRVVLTFLRT